MYFAPFCLGRGWQIPQRLAAVGLKGLFQQGAPILGHGGRMAS